MNCPYCGKEMKKGEVEVRDDSILNIGTTATWIPEDERKKFFRKNTVNLSLVAEGYYCEDCAKVVAIFSERGSGFFQ